MKSEIMNLMIKNSLYTIDLHKNTKIRITQNEINNLIKEIKKIILRNDLTVVVLRK